MKKILLIDGHNLLFRMFYGIPAPIKNSKNQDIRALIGFIGSLKKLVDKFQPYSLIVIFDTETSKKSNLEIDIDYKLNRIDYSTVTENENPFFQLPLIKKALEYLNIFYLEIEDYEADDFIASVIFNTRNSEYQYIIVSTDSDFIQLVSNDVFLYIPKGKKSVLLNEEEVIKKYNVAPQKYVVFKSLVGDRSDNIKGVMGIGNISASKILKYDTIQDYVLDNPNSRFSKLLIDNKELIRKNQKLIEMNKHIDICKVYFHSLNDSIYKLKTYEIIEKIGER